MVAGGPRCAVYGPPYLPRRRRRCFYCRALLVPAACFPSGNPLPGNMATIDHVYPRRLRPAAPAPLWHALNKVTACNWCNAKKADLPPALWVPHVSPAARAAFLDRLGALERLV